MEFALRLATAAVGLALIGGTAFRLLVPVVPAARTAAAPAAGGPGQTAGSIPAAAAVPSGQALFRGIGPLRAATADPFPATVIVAVVFPYPAADLAFAEEVAAHARDYRDLAVDLFARYTSAELRTIGEAKLKAELLRRFNGLFRLGTVDAVYFEEYLIVD